MNRAKRSENRSRILSPEGWQRLQDAIAEKFGEAYRDKPPFQQLSNLSELPGETPLDPDTVSRIWRRKKGVYRSKLERLFTALELELNQSDHISFSEDLNTEILAPDTKASTKPPRESVESDAGSIEDRIFKATNQLDPDRPMFSRMSAIQALGEIAKDYPRYQWNIMEILAAFVRDNARRKEGTEGDEERSPNISPDIQAALTVIGHRDSKKDPANQRLNLSNTDIRGANLKGANLQKANFNGANLQGSSLQGANLQKAFLSKANLQGASLMRANLQGALLMGVNLQRAILNTTKLQGVILWKANLQGAILYKTNLQGAFLGGADFSRARNLKLCQVESADGDSTTCLPKNLDRPTHWTQAAWDKGSVLKWLLAKKRDRKKLQARQKRPSLI